MGRRILVAKQDRTDADVGRPFFGGDREVLRRPHRELRRPCSAASARSRANQAREVSGVEAAGGIVESPRTS